MVQRFLRTFSYLESVLTKDEETRANAAVKSIQVALDALLNRCIDLMCENERLKDQVAGLMNPEEPNG